MLEGNVGATASCIISAAAEQSSDMVQLFCKANAFGKLVSTRYLFTRSQMLKMDIDTYCGAHLHGYEREHLCEVLLHIDTCIACATRKRKNAARCTHVRNSRHQGLDITIP